MSNLSDALSAGRFAITEDTMPGELANIIAGRVIGLIVITRGRLRRAARIGHGVIVIIV